MFFSADRKGNRIFPENTYGNTLSIRTVRIGSESLKCREYAQGEYLHFEDSNARAVDCHNENGSFYASFYGDKDSISDFYATMQSIRTEARP